MKIKSLICSALLAVSTIAHSNVFIQMDRNSEPDQLTKEIITHEVVAKLNKAFPKNKYVVVVNYNFAIQDNVCMFAISLTLANKEKGGVVITSPNSPSEFAMYASSIGHPQQCVDQYVDSVVKASDSIVDQTLKFEKSKI